MQVESEGNEEVIGNHYVVVTTTYPTSYGCHHGKSWSRAEMIAGSEVDISEEQFETYHEAVEHAKELRNSSDSYGDGYDDDDDDDDLPPWDSADLENYDNDEEILIRVMKHSEIAKEIAGNEEFLQQARIQAHLQDILDNQVIRLQVLDSGCRVHYSSPPAPYDVPAELEIDESDMNENGGFAIPDNAANIQTLMYKGIDEKMGEVTGLYDDEEHSDFDLLKLLQACTSLQELYLRSTGFQTVLGEEFVQAMLTKAPHLRRTLKVLSVASILVEPSAVSFFGQFDSLIRLDLSDCFSTEHWQEGTFDDYGMSEETLPYDDHLVECVANLESLRRLDLGNGDWDMRRYLHDYALSRHALQEVEELVGTQGGRVTLDQREMPEPFSSRLREDAAKQQALLFVKDNKDNKFPPQVVLLAEKMLKTCPVCGQSASKRCSSCQRQWYCSKECQRRDFKPHKKQCCETFEF